MRTQRLLVVAALVFTVVGMAMPASADSGLATLKYNGIPGSPYGVIWRLSANIYVPSTPYVSNVSKALSSRIFITLHDANNPNYWVRFGWCYADPATTNYCKDYNPSGSGEWVAFVELYNQSGDTIGSSPVYSTPGQTTSTMSIVYAHTGDQFTEFYLNGYVIFSIQTGFSRYGFNPANAGGFTTISNANPANGDAVWMGGLTRNNAASVFETSACLSQTTSCTWTMWWPGAYPIAPQAEVYTFEPAPTCHASPCPYTQTSAGYDDYSSAFYFWTIQY